MESSARVLGVLDGRDMPLEQLCEWALSADVVVAADGAAERLLEGRITPQHTVGDFDVLSAAARERLPSLWQDTDQESTDCDKLLAFIERELLSTSVTLIGTEGDLPDHVLATYSSAAQAALDVRIAFRRGIGWILRGGGLTIQGQPGSRISLLPLGYCSGVTMEGVRWPLAQVDLSLGERVSIANELIGNRSEVSIQSGSALVFLETDGRPFWPD